MYVITKCLQHRALHPDQPLPELSPIVAASIEVPSAVGTNSKSAVEQLKQKFKLERVNQKETATGESIFKAELVNCVGLILHLCLLFWKVGG